MSGGEASTANGNQKIALITGITGQDGSYLAEFLIEKGYEVHGVLRRSSSFNTGRIQHLYGEPALHTGGRMHLHYGDLTDTTSLICIISKVDAVGPLRLLEAVRVAGLEKTTRIYQASTSEMYGKVVEVSQNDNTPFYPRSPYACAKLYAYWMVINYREAYGMFACNGLLFNHESPRRGENFVTRKITRGVAKITLGLMQHLKLGNLDTKRDWGHSRDYVEAMWLMLQQEEPRDLVVATGETHSVREFVEKAFACVGRTVVWSGSGVAETGCDAESGRLLVSVSERYFRPTEMDRPIGDPKKSKQILGWSPKVSFDELVREMVDADLELMRNNNKA